MMWKIWRIIHALHEDLKPHVRSHSPPCRSLRSGDLEADLRCLGDGAAKRPSVPNGPMIALGPNMSGPNQHEALVINSFLLLVVRPGAPNVASCSVRSDALVTNGGPNKPFIGRLPALCQRGIRPSDDRPTAALRGRSQRPETKVHYRRPHRRGICGTGCARCLVSDSAVD